MGANDWTGHDDAKSRCGQNGAVAAAESVGVFLFRKTDESEIPWDTFFRRKVLAAPDEKQTISNDCGNSSGLSVQRRRDGDSERVLEMAKEQASKKVGRVSEGVATASVGVLRNIKLSDESKQRVFVYDDGREGDPLHAVIRVASCNRAAFDDIRTQIIDAFSERLAPE